MHSPIPETPQDPPPQQPSSQDREFDQFFNEQGEPWGNDQTLKAVYRENFNLIKNRDPVSRTSHTYYRYLNGIQFNLIQAIERAVEEVYRLESHSFKLVLTFAYILQDKEMGEFRFFYGLSNTRITPRPRLIQTHDDLIKLLNFLATKDFPTFIRELRPNSKWQLERIVNLQLRVFPTSYPLGKPPELPDFIKSNRHIYGLEKDKHTGQTYNHNLWFFRNIAIGKHGCCTKNCNIKAKELFLDYCQHFDVDPDDFQGVELEDFYTLENFFEVQLFAMCLKEDGSAETLYLSQTTFQTQIYMNVFEHHLSFIKDPQMYAKVYICNRCDKLFARAWNLNKHQRKCDEKVRLILPGGVYKNTLSVFEDLERLGCWGIEEEDKCEKWLCTYDFEAIQRDFDDKVDDVELLEEGARWNKIHDPVSFSIGCNLDGVETVHVSSKDPGELMSKFVDVLLEIAEKRYAACIDRYEHIFVVLGLAIDREQARLDGIDQRTYTGDDLVRNKDGKVVSTKLLKELESVNLRFESYCMELPVFGFNSAGYDVKLVKKYLFKELCRRGESPSFTVKKGGKYPCIKTPSLKFLDILQFLAPGYSLKSFFKAFDANEEKGFFPYDYFTSTDQLDETSLPPYKTFYSAIKGCNVLEEEFNANQKLRDQGKNEQEALQALRLTEIPKTGRENYEWLNDLWNKNGWTTFADYLRWYNDLDVTPMITAIERMNEYYKEKNIDFMHQAITLPGVAKRVCLDSITDLTAEIHLFSQKQQDIYNLFKENIVGGPSLIFNREMEVGKSFIHNNPDKPCKSVIGYDANALYLWSIGQLQGTGIPLTR